MCRLKPAISWGTHATAVTEGAVEACWPAWVILIRTRNRIRSKMLAKLWNHCKWRNYCPWSFDVERIRSPKKKRPQTHTSDESVDTGRLSALSRSEAASHSAVLVRSDRLNCSPRCAIRDYHCSLDPSHTDSDDFAVQHVVQHLLYARRISVAFAEPD